jgi:hypothetical protein
MNRSTVVKIVVATTLAGAAGCQSGPRWAWWKRDEAPQDASLIARSAAPPLPSSQATPQAVAGTGIAPATPPSAANLTAASATGSTTTATPAASAATLAAAPKAAYPATATAAPYPTTATSMNVPSAAGSALSASVAQQVGPYDPNGYRPATGAVSATAGTLASDAQADRYGEVANISADRNMATPARPAGAEAMPLEQDRYATNPVATGVPPVAAGVAPSQTAAAPPSAGGTMSIATAIAPPAVSGGPATGTTPPAATPGAIAAADRYGSLPAAPTALETAATPAVVAPSSTEIPIPVGPYRPGGTSDYVSGSANHIEVASRPATTTPAPQPATEEPTTAAPTNEPSVPPYSPAPAGGAGTRPY